jgi:predicted TIM-barrel fold metal-dependent hydrolase
MKVIDADAHVEECAETWSFLEPEFHRQRPLPILIDPDTPYGRNNAVWLIEGKVFPKLAGRGLLTFATPPISEYAKAKPIAVGAQSLTDIEARLADLDRLGIACQVVFPTLFLAALADDVALEAALCRSYNNWMADNCARSRGRLKFAAVVPLRDVAGSVRELRRARGLGAVAVMAPGIVWDKELGNREFFPFYEEVCRLDLPLCVHFAWGAPGLTDLFQTLGSSRFAAGVLPVIMGFFSLLSCGVLDEFPHLRVAFLEAGGGWLPHAIHQLEGARPRFAGGKKPPAEYFKDGRLYVAIEADEDINYLAAVAGEDHLLIASDYPHGDPSHEEDMVGALEKRADLAPRLREKILSHNPARLYAL